MRQTQILFGLATGLAVTRLKLWLKVRFVSRRARAEEYSYQQQPVPALQFAGEYNLVTPPQVVHTSNPDRRQSPGDLVGLQPVQPYTCVCGFAFDRTTGKFCPRCGRPKVQQGIS